MTLRQQAITAWLTYLVVREQLQIEYGIASGKLSADTKPRFDEAVIANPELLPLELQADFYVKLNAINNISNDTLSALLKEIQELIEDQKQSIARGIERLNADYS